MDAPSPVVLSASQVQTWIDCQRKWAWDRIVKIPREQHPSAALGTRTHSQLEHYLRDGRPLQFTLPDGTPDDSAYIAAPSLSFLPAPKSPGLEIEKRFRFLSPNTGLVYNGIIDWRLPPDADGIPTDGDHKTTSGLQWAKTAEDLWADVQAITYAADTLIRWPNSPRVRLQWTYMQTRGARRALPVVTELEADHVARAFQAVEEVGLQIATTLHRAKAATSPEDREAFVRELPPNPHACRMYGGCPYQHVCNLSPREVMRASMSNTGSLSLLDRLRAQASAPATPAPDTSPGGSAIKFDETWAQAPSDAAASQENAQTPGVGVNDAGALRRFGPSVALPTPSVPPTSTVQPPASSTIAIAPTALPGQSQLVAVNPPEYQPPPTAEQRDGTPTPTPAAEKPKRGPGRPRGSKNKPAETPAVADMVNAMQGQIAAVVSQVSEVQQPAPVGTVAGTTPDGGVLVKTPGTPGPDLPQETEGEHLVNVLFIDCLPLSGEEYMPGANLASQANEMVAEHTGKSDYRYLDFGQGPGALVDAALEVLGKFDAPPSVTLDTRTPEGAILCNRLEARAKHVVRGLR